jgi:hypothetical protein
MCNPGLPLCASLFQPVATMSDIAEIPPTSAPQHGILRPGYARDAHVEHRQHADHYEQPQGRARLERDDQVGRDDQVERDEQLEQLEQDERDEEPLLRTVYRFDDEDQLGDDVDALLEFNPKVDPAVLGALVEECCAYRDQLPEMLKTDDDTLDAIEEKALAKLAGQDLFLYRKALNQTDWMFN